MKIWITSDTHFGHKNMIPYCGRPENFDEILIENWKRLVAKDDLVIHLGDVIMGERAAARLPEIMDELPGKKVLCRGNHDVEKAWGDGKGFMERGFDFVCDSFVYDRYAFSHCPITPLPHRQDRNWQEEVILNFHGHFHNATQDKIEIANMDHYQFNHIYYNANRSKYQLIQIEDTLAPYSLEEAIGMWLPKSEGGDC